MADICYSWLVNKATLPKYALPTILLAALVIRTWGIDHQIYTDENKVITPSVQLAQGKQKPLLYPKGSYYPHFYHYILGASFLTPAFMQISYPSADTSVDIYTLIARIITAVIGTATVYGVYKIGQQLSGPNLGYVTALLFAFLPLHVKYSHYAHVDIPLTLITTLATWASLRLWNTGRRRWYVMTGILVGIAGAIHYTGFVIGIVLLLSHAAIVLRNRPYTLHTVCSRNFLLGILCIPMSFMLATPYTIIEWRESFRIYEQLNLRGAAGDLGYTRPNFIWPLTTTSPDWGLPFTVSGLLWESNALLVACAGIGLLIAIYKRQWQIVVLIGGTMFIMYIAIIGRLPLYAVKRLLPLTPLLSICAAWAIIEVARLKKSNRIVMQSAAIAIATLISIQNGITDMGFVTGYASGSTHSMAVAWAEQHIPHGSFVLQHSPIKLIDWSNPNYNTERLNEVYANFNASDPEVSHDRAKSITDWIAEKHIQYVVMDSRIVDRYFDSTSMMLFPETTASYRALYTSIRTQGNLIYSIQPELWHIAGPRIEIYDVRNIQ